MRTIVDIPDDDIRWLDQRAATTGKSRTAIVREAVEMYRSESSDDRDRRRAALRAGFGAWKGRTDIGDAVEWQRRERASWTRPWDPDYEEVKAEFPDLFDDQDDRERAHYLALDPTLRPGRS
jgi:predicted transcriptional regulator